MKFLRVHLSNDPTQEIYINEDHILYVHETKTTTGRRTDIMTSNTKVWQVAETPAELSTSSQLCTKCQMRRSVEIPTEYVKAFKPTNLEDLV